MPDVDTEIERPTPLHSAADFDFDRQARNEPPWGGADRATELFKRFPKNTWFKIFSDLNHRWMRVGEIGYTAPNAATQHFGDNSCSIIVNSGLFDFVQAVATILFAGTTMHTQGGETQPSWSQEEVARQLAALYEQWRGGDLWRGSRVTAPAITLPEQAATDAAHLAATAMLFIMSHEVGHAVLHADVLPQDRNAAQENQADAWGFDLAVLGYGLERRDARMAIVGAAIALRMLAALHILGHVFPGHHPSPVRRLVKLREALMTMSANEAAFFDNTTIAYAFEEMMEMAENIILGRGEISAITADRLVSRLWSGIIEVRREHITFDILRTMFTRDVRQAPPPVLRRVVDTCRRLFSPSQLGKPGQATDVDEKLKYFVETFDQLVAALPADLATSFHPPPAAI